MKTEQIKAFTATLIELNLPDESNVVNGEVECASYLVQYECDTKGKHFFFAQKSFEPETPKYIWQCECSFDDLTDEDKEEMLEYRGLYDLTVDDVTLEDWWMSGIKIRYVGYIN